MSLEATETDQYSRGQLERLADDPNTVILNLGCGRDDTGIGIDIHYDPDIEYDLNDGIPAVDDSADAIIANHILEHLENPSQFYREARRVLKADGTLHLECPNVAWLPVRLWLSQDMHRFWSHKDPDSEGHWLARRLGNTERERTAHLSLWTRELLRQHLDRAGFTYDIEGRHWSRNFTVTAWPGDGAAGDGQTLHELERTAGADLASGDYWAQTRARIMSRWVDDRDASRVLDVGCGSGYLTARIADADPTRDVLGIDHNQESIQIAQSRETSARFEVADAFELDDDLGTFDVLVYGDVLEHFEEPVRLLEATKSLLADDGTIIVSVPAFRWLYGPHDEHNNHYDRYTASRLADEAATAGYGLERSTYTNLVPLLPYFIYQRVLKRQVPHGARGGHSRVLEALKRMLIRAESAVQWPVGVTLLAEFTHE